ncbi:MAG: EI24 domain-containing protein [Deltaproteobacteria bacterium]|nr:EI24 domain-containing protein [Deltaproteobacteria bacterium]
MASGGLVQGVIQGATAPLRGYRFLSANPSLKRLAIVPLAINAVIFTVAVIVFVNSFGSILGLATGVLAVGAGTGFVHAILAALSWVATVIVGALLVVLFAAAIFFGFTLVGGFVAAPFNEVLSQRAEALRLAELGLAPAPPEGATTGVAAIWREARYAFGAELRRTGLYLGVMAGLAILNVLPVIGTALFSVLGGLTSCYFFAWDHTDLAMSRRRMPFAEKRLILAEHRAAALAFGATALAITAVPFLNLLMLPVQVVAGTLLFLEWHATPPPGT